MIIIGEKINTSVKAVNTAVEIYDEVFIKDIALKQVENGADYLDINCGTFTEDEPERMRWLVDTVQEVVNIPLCLDSPNAKALETGLRINKNGTPIINSITAQKERWNSIFPLVIDYNTKVIVLCMDDDGIPEGSEGRVRIALKVVNEMVKNGVELERVYFDPMVQPISVDSQNGLVVLEAIRRIKKEIPEAYVICGISNISFGLPARKLINQAFLVSAICSGLDAGIIDPLDRRLMGLVYAAEALAGKDEYCMEYINKYRSGFLE